MANAKDTEYRCRHCGEDVERRDGEVVTKFGNDPQCDESPNDNHEAMTISEIEWLEASEHPSYFRNVK